MLALKPSERPPWKLLQAPRWAAHTRPSSRVERLPEPTPALGIDGRTKAACGFSSVAELGRSANRLEGDDAPLAVPMSSVGSHALLYAGTSRFTVAAGRTSRTHSCSSGTGDGADLPVPSRRLTTLGGEMSEASSMGRGELPSLLFFGGSNPVPNGSCGDVTNDSLVCIGDNAEASSVHGDTAAKKPLSDRGVLGKPPSIIHHGTGDDTMADDGPPPDNRRLDAGPLGPTGPTSRLSRRLGGVDGVADEPLASPSQHCERVGESVGLEKPEGRKGNGPSPGRPESSCPIGLNNLSLASSAASSKASSSSRSDEWSNLGLPGEPNAVGPSG